MRGSVLCLALLMLAGWLLASSPAAAEPVRIGILAHRSADITLEQWRPLVDGLEQAIPEREFTIEALDYPALEQAVATRRLDFVLTNSGHYILLLRRYGLSAPLATRVARVDGQDVAVFGGVIIVRADNEDIHQLPDLAGRRIGFVDRDSMGGFQMQAYELRSAGVSLPSDRLLGPTGMPHDRVVERVLAGDVEAGFVRSGLIESMAGEGLVDLDAIRVINAQDLVGLPFAVSTRLYPEWPVAALPGIDPELARQVASALLGLKDQPALAAAPNMSVFNLPADYSVLEDMLRELRVAPFDSALEVTAADLWRQYWRQILLLAAAFGLLLILVSLLTVGSRRLKRLQNIIRRSPVVAMSWRNEPGWPVSYISDNIDRFGYDRTAFLSGQLHYDELIHPDDLPEVAAQVEHHLNHGPDQYEQHYRLRHGDGHWIRIHNHTWLTRSRHGQVTGIHGVLMDVTEQQEAEERAEHLRHLLRYVIEHARYAVAVHDRDLNYLFVSRNYLETFDVSDPDVIGKHHYEVFPDLPQKWRDAHQRVLQGEVLSAEEDPMVHPDGSMDWTRWECRPWLDADGSIGGLIVYTEIITERKQAELELREKTAALARSNERLEQLATVFTHAREGVIIADAAGDIVEVNDSFTRITGYPREEVLGRNPRILSSGRQDASFYRALWQDLETCGHWKGEIWNRRKSGEIYPQNSTITAVRDEDGRPVQYIALFSDLSDRERHARELEYLAYHDELTGLPNRRLLTKHLEQAMARADQQETGLAVAYLDLDDFKQINDDYGQAAGDRVLCELSERLRSNLRAGDLVARLGGDELVVVFCDVSGPEVAAGLLDELLALAARPLQVEGGDIRLGATIGVTLYPQPETPDADQLMRQADQAMYQAKQAGKACFQFFDHEQEQAIRGRFESLQRLREALAQQEFVLFYQPKANMRSGEVIGAEALIRWQHPERGLLAPGEFLPLLENDELALELGAWVLEEALSQADAWRRQGLDLVVSVNVFARQLQHEAFVDDLRAALARYPKLGADRLEIEILETSALEDIDRISTVVRQCQSLGVLCALDDFGTGYSSLTYLKRLPAAILKIDQSFVRDMLDDPEDLAILSGTLGLATAFQRVPVAEGVETLAHGEILLDLGCELAQGYGIARPMPAADLPDWVRSWQPAVSWKDRPARNATQVRLLFAMVEHRAWVAQVAGCVESGHKCPELSEKHCAFGRWLHGQAEELGISDQMLAELHEIHDEIHRLGKELVEQQAHETDDTQAADLARLHALRDCLIAKLTEIEQSLATSAA